MLRKSESRSLKSSVTPTVSSCKVIYAFNKKKRKKLRAFFFFFSGRSLQGVHEKRAKHSPLFWCRWHFAILFFFFSLATFCFLFLLPLKKKNKFWEDMQVFKMYTHVYMHAHIKRDLSTTFYTFLVWTPAESKRRDRKGAEAQKGHRRKYIYIYNE